MSDGFIVKPLKCGHCGHELPVMGQFVTFKCSTCLKYWVLSTDGLKPINVYRALLPEDAEAEPVYLPFWLIEMDKTAFRNRIEEVTSGLKATAQTILQTTVQAEEDAFEIDRLEQPDLDIGLIKARFVSEAGRTNRLLTSSESSYLERRVEGNEPYYIFVPSFLSYNTYAYLKVGKLLTRAQPAFRTEKSAGLGKPVLCALQADEALALIDFIFFATLPDSIQSNGDFLKSISLEAVGAPYLVEFPFEHRGASLMSLIGNFTISSRLVEGLAPGAAPAADSPS
jgi:hypothetical protein